MPLNRNDISLNGTEDYTFCPCPLHHISPLVCASFYVLCFLRSEKVTIDVTQGEQAERPMRRGGEELWPQAERPRRMMAAPAACGREFREQTSAV